MQHPQKKSFATECKKDEGNYFALQCLLHRCAYSVPLLQLHHADDSFLVLTTDGINFMVNSQEICDFVNQCHDPTEAAHLVIEQVMPGLLLFFVWFGFKTKQVYSHTFNSELNCAG